MCTVVLQCAHCLIDLLISSTLDGLVDYRQELVFPHGLGTVVSGIAGSREVDESLQFILF